MRAGTVAGIDGDHNMFSDQESHRAIQWVLTAYRFGFGKLSIGLRGFQCKASLQGKRWISERGKIMPRKLFAVLIACSVLQSASGSTAGAQAGGGKVDVRDRIRVLPPDSSLEVKLTNGEKLKGNLGVADQEGFELRIARKGAIAPRKVAFAEVRSIRVKHGMSTGAKIGLGVGIFAAVAVLVTGLVLGAIGRNE
jgi:hypothetical protein